MEVFISVSYQSYERFVGEYEEMLIVLKLETRAKLHVDHLIYGFWYFS